MASPLASTEKMLRAMDAEDPDGDSSSELLRVTHGAQHGPRMTSLRGAAALLGSMALVGLLAGSLRNAEVSPSRGRANVKFALGRSEFAATGAEGLAANANDKNDGNPCATDEELNGVLCYKKCSLLTDGGYPVRTSGVTCCKSKPCTLFNQKHDLGLCSGFSVAGDTLGQGACPHTPGACLNDEEEHVGQCYQKCSILTDGLFPYRSGPDTCCKSPNEMACFPGTYNTRTSFAFAVGGGKGDGDKDTPSGVHAPLEALTEAQPSTTAEVRTTVASVETETTKAKPTEQLPAEEAAAPAAEKPAESAMPDWAQDVIAPKAGEKSRASSKKSPSKKAPTPMPAWAMDLIEDPTAGKDGSIDEAVDVDVESPAPAASAEASAEAYESEGYVAPTRVATDDRYASDGSRYYGSEGSSMDALLLSQAQAAAGGNAPDPSATPVQRYGGMTR